MIRATIVALLGVLAGLAGVAQAEAAAKKPPPRVLVYSGTEGFRHPSIDVGNEVIARMARRTGRFRVKLIDEPQELTAARLAASDIVVWNSTTGAESPFTHRQESAYMSWVRCGGGHIGVHASTDSYRDWRGWAKLTGAFFKTHPAGEPEARILVRHRTSPITAPWRGQTSFLIPEELYVLDRDPADVVADFRVVLAFGAFTDPAVAAEYGALYPRHQPLAWTGSYRGRNRLYYTNLGHAIATWQRADFRRSLRGAISWVARKRPSRSCLRRAGVLTRGLISAGSSD